jgi:hypothetical protein
MERTEIIQENKLFTLNRKSGFLHASANLWIVFMLHCFACFQYVNMLKQGGPKEWIFQEYKDILSMNFRFKDKESPRSYVSNTVHNLHVSQNFQYDSEYLFAVLLWSMCNGKSIAKEVVKTSYANRAV